MHKVAYVSSSLNPRAKRINFLACHTTSVNKHALPITITTKEGKIWSMLMLHCRYTNATHLIIGRSWRTWTGWPYHLGKKYIRTIEKHDNFLEWGRFSLNTFNINYFLPIFMGTWPLLPPAGSTPTREMELPPYMRAYLSFN